MKPEKMTDEALANANQIADWLNSEGKSTCHKLLAHIAALTAERDDYKRSNESVLAHNDTLRERVQQITAERDAVGRLAVERGAELDALRERVQALEKLRDDYHVLMNSRGDWQARAEHAESRLAAIRQRAGDTKALVEAHQSGMGCASVARYILGEDASASPQTDDLSAIEQYRENGEAAARVEPSTAEAFATVRSSMEACGSVHDVSGRALSLLERRMGAMELAARDAVAVLHSIGQTKADAPLTGDQCAEMTRVKARLHYALTDAPPVFTLEEVQTALVAELESPNNCGVSYVDCCAAACDGLVKRLTATRR